MCVLLQKYRPVKLADVLGQPAVTRALSLYSQEPYPAAFLLHGTSGIGKTATAIALAHELGCLVEEQEMGGFTEIPSGEMSAEEVRRHLHALRLRPFMGSGWKVLVCNEADRMSLPAETLWLDALEHLPPSTTIVFTTNAPEKLSKRFRDRCETFGFETETAKLKPHIRRLAQDVWKREGGKGTCPALDTLGMPTLTGVDDMYPSFRLALQQLSKLVRESRAGGTSATMKAVVRQLATDHPEYAGQAKCDHCGKAMEVRAGSASATCPHCKKTNRIEW